MHLALQGMHSRMSRNFLVNPNSFRISEMAAICGRAVGPKGRQFATGPTGRLLQRLADFAASARGDGPATGSPISRRARFASAGVMCSMEIE